MFAEPGFDTFVMEPVRTWQDGYAVTERDFVHAYAAVRFTSFVLILFRDGAFGQSCNCIARRRTRSVAGLMLFHELGHYSVERFLCVDSISRHSTRWAEELEEVAKGAHAAYTSCPTATDDEGTSATGSKARMHPIVRYGTAAHAAGHCAEIHHHLVDHVLDVVRLRLKWLRGVGVAWEEIAAESGV